MMYRLFNTFFAVALAGTPTISPAAVINLNTYRWNNRLLLVFSPTESDPSFVAFSQLISSSVLDIEDRDLVVFQIFDKGSSRLGRRPLSLEDADGLRRRFGVKRGRFTVILVGKDGSEKMVREGQLELQEIFDRIDSMPMRQREMREKEK